MNQIWTEDPERIREEIEFLIANKINLICGRRDGNNITKLTIQGTGRSKDSELLILLHPQQPNCQAKTCIFYYRLRGKPLRSFEVERVRQHNNLLAIKFPTQILNIHRRNHERVTTPNNSRASFSLRNKNRVQYGQIEDISLGGAKINTDIPVVMAVGDMVCHITLTLCSRFPTVEDVQIHLPEAKVIWLEGDEEKTTVLGLSFTVEDQALNHLANYIDLRLIEGEQDSPFQTLPPSPSSKPGPLSRPQTPEDRF